MKYRCVTVRRRLQESDRMKLDKALGRAEVVPERSSVSSARGEMRFTLKGDSDMGRVRQCLKAVGLQVVEDIEVES